MSRKWTIKEYKESNRSLRYRLFLAESQNARLKDELNRVIIDRNHYRSWILSFQDNCVELLTKGLSMNISWHIRNITETRGAGLP